MNSTSFEHTLHAILQEEGFQVIPKEILTEERVILEFISSLPRKEPRDPFPPHHGMLKRLQRFGTHHVRNLSYQWDIQRNQQWKQDNMLWGLFISSETDKCRQDAGFATKKIHVRVCSTYEDEMECFHARVILYGDDAKL
jgi:hypothetical protein